MLACTCQSAYGEITDVDKAIETAERLEARPNPHTSADTGTAPTDQGKPLDAGLHDVPGFDNQRGVERGFWKQSEFLRCQAGKNFANGDLDMSRYQTGTWARARSNR